MVSTAQDNSRGEDVAAQVNSAAIFPAPEDNSSLPEENSDKSTAEGGDQRAWLCMFTGVPVKRVANGILRTALLPAKGPGDSTILVKDLKNEIQALKTKCNMLETTVKNMESVQNTHQRTLETLRQHIVSLQSHMGTLDLSYQGEELDVMQ
jgi:hypothetical protein